MADPFETVLLRLANKAGPGESIGPADVAREIAQETGVEWEQLLKAVRRAAVRLALDGHAVILLKGEVVDPENFRGVYRIGGMNYFTPRKMEPHHAVRHAPLAPAHDYKPRPSTPPPAAAAPQPAPVLPTAAPILPAITPPSPQQVEPIVEDILRERNFAEEIESAFEAALLARENAGADADEHDGPKIDEGRPVTRFEYAIDTIADDEADVLDEAEPAEDLEEPEAELPSPLPPLPPSLSFDDDDDEGHDEDAGRAPRPATLDDIASQLERYLAAELNNPSRRDAEIGDDVVGLPGEQDK
jgi:hypothetical protein